MYIRDFLTCQEVPAQRRRWCQSRVAGTYMPDSSGIERVRGFSANGNVVPSILTLCSRWDTELTVRCSAAQFQVSIPLGECLLYTNFRKGDGSSEIGSGARTPIVGLGSGLSADQRGDNPRVLLLLITICGIIMGTHTTGWLAGCVHASAVVQVGHILLVSGHGAHHHQRSWQSGHWADARRDWPRWASGAAGDTQPGCPSLLIGSWPAVGVTGRAAMHEY